MMVLLRLVDASQDVAFTYHTISFLPLVGIVNDGVVSYRIVSYSSCTVLHVGIVDDGDPSIAECCSYRIVLLYHIVS